MSKRTCALTGNEFTVSELEQQYCSRFGVPLPDISPLERLRSVLIFRNRVYLYQSSCAISGKKLLSCYPPEAGLKACDQDIARSDQVDNKTFGRPYDFSRSFFEQFHELYRDVYLPSLNVISPENSDYTNGTTGAKNCYLVFSSSYSEDCLFSHGLFRARNVVDCAYAHDSELCYQCVDIKNCYNLKWSSHCRNCSDSSFLSNCQACADCYGCVNLNHKRFYYFNDALSEEEYRRRLSDIDLASSAVVAREAARFAEFCSTFPRKHYFGSNNQNSSGNFISNNKDCVACQFVNDCEDCADSIFVNVAKNSIVHATFGNNSELIYNCTTVGENAYNVRFCFECWSNVSDLEYCGSCTNGVEHCFGCAGLRRASYCILNRQYPKEEYFDLLARVKKQMLQTGEYGRFFPSFISPFYYNESETGSFFPLSEEQALAWGFRWRKEPESDPPRLMTVPDHIRNLAEDAAQHSFRCSRTGKAFRLIKQELQFYRDRGIAPPSIAPLERIRSRLRLFEIRPLAEVSCTVCSAPIQTVYHSDKQPVLCEECFNGAIY